MTGIILAMLLLLVMVIVGHYVFGSSIGGFL